MTETDRQEQPYVAWLDWHERHLDRNPSIGLGNMQSRRALRELRARDAEIASLKARVAELREQLEHLGNKREIA